MKTSPRRARGLLAVSLLALSLLSSAGCRTSELVERTPVTVTLRSFRSVALVVTARTAARHMRDFYDMLLERLKDEEIFAQVQGAAAGPTDLLMRVTLLDLQDDSGVFSNGPVEVRVGVELFDTRRGVYVGLFEVTGSSKKPFFKAFSGGASTSLFSDPEGKALASAANEIVGYLEDHAE